MIFWIDAQLPPQLALWLRKTFLVEAFSLRDLGLRDAEDREIFTRAKAEKTIIITKDRDFLELVYRFDSPPQILWVTCGNVTNRNLKLIFTQTFLSALTLLQQGEKFDEDITVDFQALTSKDDRVAIIATLPLTDMDSYCTESIIGISKW